jgi:serine/threonine protein kinase
LPEIGYARSEKGWVGLVKKNQETGALARGYRLGKLGLSLMGSYVGYQAQNLLLGEADRTQRQARFQQKTSRRVRDELGELKGVVMKMGQLLSMQSQVLPVEALQELANLQMRAPGMHPTLARAQFKSALGKYPEEVFREFDPEPFAAASLGQVHRAVTLDGEKVAVKIQYPAIRSAIENDFKLLRSATLPGHLTGYMPAALLDEIQRGFLEETDYLHEADNLDFFGKGLKSLAYLEIPRVYRELTSGRVLTMSYLEGERVEDFLKHKPSSALRDLIGARLVELYYIQMHQLKAIHADHHPGNYLFRSDGGIGLVDFGCVKRITFDISDLLDCCSRQSWREGDAQARHVVGLIFGRNVPFKRARKVLPALNQAADILYAQSAASRVVNFGQPRMLEILTHAMMQAVRDRVINPEFAFISRADMGLYHLLHRLGARVDVGGTWRRVSAASSMEV